MSRFQAWGSRAAAAEVRCVGVKASAAAGVSPIVWRTQPVADSGPAPTGKRSRPHHARVARTLPVAWHSSPPTVCAGARTALQEPWLPAAEPGTAAASRSEAPRRCRPAASCRSTARTRTTPATGRRPRPARAAAAPREPVCRENRPWGFPRTTTTAGGSCPSHAAESVP